MVESPFQAGKGSRVRKPFGGACGRTADRGAVVGFPGRGDRRGDSGLGGPSCCRLCWAWKQVLADRVEKLVSVGCLRR